MATARILLQNRQSADDEEDALLVQQATKLVDEERSCLERIVQFLERKLTDPKLDAVLHFLI